MVVCDFIHKCGKVKRERLERGSPLPLFVDLWVAGDCHALALQAIFHPIMIPNAW
jgi:hypothetical protein